MCEGVNMWRSEDKLQPEHGFQEFKLGLSGLHCKFFYPLSKNIHLIYLYIDYTNNVS